MSTVYNIIPLLADGENTTTLNLSIGIISIVTRYNYLSECWCMDILDANGDLMLAGIMLVPLIDLLAPHTAVKQEIGTFLLIEKYTGAYKDPDKLGTDTALLWYAPGEDIEIPT